MSLRLGLVGFYGFLDCFLGGFSDLWWVFWVVFLSLVGIYGFLGGFLSLGLGLGELFVGGCFE